MVADADRRTVEHHAVEVNENATSDEQAVTIVAVKRRTNQAFVRSMRQQLAERLAVPGRIHRQRVEPAQQRGRPAAILAQLRVERLELLAPEHLFPFGHRSAQEVNVKK